ncbi:hypothetical protein JXO52_09255 [bacterium]|nr:hypothetical protein [bacterium]
MKLKKVYQLFVIAVFCAAVAGPAATAGPAPADTILYLPFDGGTEDAGPLSITSEAKGGFTYDEGVKGKAVWFDGESNYLAVDPVEELHLSGVFTISFWFKYGTLPDFKDGESRYLMRLEADTLRRSAGYLLSLEGIHDTTSFRSDYGNGNWMSGAGTNKMKMAPDIWYHLITTHTPSYVSHLLVDEQDNIISFNYQKAFVHPEYTTLQCFLGGLDREGLHPRLLERWLYYRGFLDEFVVLSDSLDTESIFKDIWRNKSAADLKPFLDCQTRDFKNYGQYGSNNGVHPIVYIDLLLQKDPLNAEYYAAKWIFHKQLQNKDEYGPIIQQEIRTVLQECPVSEQTLMVALNGYRLLDMDTDARALEERIVAEYPGGGLARQRRIRAANPLMKVIEPTPYNEITDTLFADLKIGQSITETPEEELDPDYVLMGVNAIAVNEAGHIFAVSRETFQISEFDGQGVFVRTYGGQPELSYYITTLRGLHIDGDGNLLGVSSREDTTMLWMMTIPEGELSLLGRNEEKGKFYKLMPHPDGLWANSDYAAVYGDYATDVKGEALSTYVTDDKVIDLYRATPKTGGALTIEPVWSGVAPLTNGGTLEGRYDHFTLKTLNDVSYDFDAEGNIYVANRFLPRFRKFTRDGEPVWDYEFNYFGDGKVRYGIGFNGYKAVSAFNAVRTRADGACILLRHTSLELVDTQGNSIRTILLAGLPSEKNARTYFIASNGYGNKTFIMTRDGKHLYAVAGRNTIYRYTLPEF